MSYVIRATHDKAGQADIFIGAAGYTSGGCALANRAQRFTVGNGTQYRTMKGAMRTLEKIKAAVAGHSQWEGWTLTVATAGG